MIHLLLLKPPVGSLSAVATFSASHADSAAVTARGSGIFSRAATNNLILLFPSLIILSTNQLITCKRMDMIKLTILRSCISLTKNDGALLCLYVSGVLLYFGFAPYWYFNLYFVLHDDFPWDKLSSILFYLRCRKIVKDSCQRLAAVSFRRGETENSSKSLCL